MFIGNQQEGRMMMPIRLNKPKAARRLAVVLGLSTLMAATAQAEDFRMPAENTALHAQLPEAIRNRKVIRVVSTFGYAPQQFYGEDGVTPEGFSVDLARALGAVTGIQVEFTNASFDALIPGLDAGRFDMAIAAMSATAERGAKVNFVIYEKAGARLLVSGGNPKKINGLQDLCGLTVASLKGSLHNDVIEQVSAKCAALGKKPVRLDTYDNSDSVYQSLLTGRTDANYRDGSPLIYVAKMSEGRLEVVGPEYPDHPYGIAIAGENKDFAKVIAAALDVIIRSGTYQAILNKWGLGTLNVDSAVLTPIGSPASAFPQPPSPIGLAFGK
ncbi:ABC transporter substrate-binding protein [Rhizobium sp. BR 314]|uniref:ABC transporter substrate-binding protein n=1 Tax=Rhizobium sp. BR 314 TaxID=3040013 RepID=UPI0039BF9ABB